MHFVILSPLMLLFAGYVAYILLQLIATLIKALFFFGSILLSKCVITSRQIIRNEIDLWT